MNKQIVIVGAGGHGKVIADIAKKIGYIDIIFLDDDPSVAECGGYSVNGTSKDISRYADRDFVVAIGNSRIRQKIQDLLVEVGMRIATLVHPNAVIGENVTLGEGTVVMAGAVVNPCSKIGRGSIINTCASVDHDCIIGDYAHVSIGAHVAGSVMVGDRTWIGAGATVSNDVAIASDCMIGAGAVVVNDLTESDTYIGIPARKMKTNKQS